jgi:hypothetical protein
MSELSEDSKFQISIKTLGAIAALIATLVGFYYKLHSEIQEAKELPKIGTGIYMIDPADTRAKETYPPTRGEFSMKDQMSRQTLLQMEKDIERMKKDLDILKTKVTLLQARRR